MKPWAKALLIVALILVLLAGVAPFVIPIPPLKDIAPIEQLADADSRFVDVQGVRVHYKLLGQGEPAILLLHGFGASLYSWREVLEPLSHLGTVVAYDRPAFGLSARPMPGEWQGASPYAPDAQVELAIGLLDALGLRKAVLVGHSAGGAIAVLTALRYPERVQALVLVDAAIYEGGGAPAWIRPLLRTPQMQRLGPLFARSVSILGERFLVSAWHDPTRVTPEIRANYRKPLRVANWDRALWEFTLASQNQDLGAQLYRLRVPTFVVSGEHDRIVPLASSERLAQALGVDLLVVPDSGHLPHEEQPARFLEGVLPFLAVRR